jgi:hypothetical protein
MDVETARGGPRSRVLVEHRAVIEWPSGLVSGPLHLTVLHFGRLDDLASDLRESCGVRVDAAALRRAVVACTAPVSLPGGEVAVLGPETLGSGTRPVPVVLVDYPLGARIAREVIWDGFMRFLGSLGVSDPELCAARSANLRHSRPAFWRPHVTVRSGVPVPWGPATARLADAVLRLPPLAADGTGGTTPGG